MFIAAYGRIASEDKTLGEILQTKTSNGST